MNAAPRWPAALLLAAAVAVQAQTAGAPARTAPIAQLRMLAAEGDGQSKLLLGLAYERGDGVTRDDREALRWIRLAAEQGVADAQLQLGRRHLQGRGVPQDDAEARRWLELAARQGQAEARQLLQPRAASAAD